MGTFTLSDAAGSYDDGVPTGIHPTFPEEEIQISVVQWSLDHDNWERKGINTTAGESSGGAEADKPLTVYKSRYYVLLVYSGVLFYQCMIWNNWGPISSSALEAFPSWTEATVASLANWGPITYVTCVVPMSWAVVRWGMRPVMVAITFSVAVGHGLRCVSIEEEVFTVFAHVCAVFNGIEGTLLLAGAMVPALWFPPEQRVTATAFSSLLGQMGSGGSFLQPLLVRSPSNTTHQADIRADIQTLMFIEFGIAVALFIAVIVYFPSAPPSPPSRSSEVERYNFSDGFKSMAKNVLFWNLVIPYGAFTGVSMVWLGVINFSLQDLGLSQDETGWIGVYVSISTGVVCLAVSRLADVFYGHLKATLLVLMSTSAFFYVWFMLLSLGVVPFSKAQVYITVLGGESFNFACSPIFLELCVEAVYPGPESGVGTVSTWLNNFVGGAFMLLFFIPGISSNGMQWMTYVLVGSTVLSVPPVALAKEKYKRSRLDRPTLKE